MDRFSKPQFMPKAAPPAQPATAGATASMSVGQASVPAAWPTGVSPLAQAVDACQRRETSDADWLARAPNSIVLPPAFLAR